MRNPAQSGMAILRLFISSSLAGTNQKIKKAKQMDSANPPVSGLLEKLCMHPLETADTSFLTLSSRRR